MQVLDEVSWEFFGLVMDCLEHPVTSHDLSIGGSGGGGLRSSNGQKSPAVTEAASHQGERVSTFCEQLALQMAEVFSPKELHMIAMEHLRVYDRTRRAFFVLLSPAVVFLPSGESTARVSTLDLPKAAAGTRCLGAQNPWWHVLDHRNRKQ